MLALGTKAANFEIPDVISGDNVSLQNIKGDKGTVVMFICNHCPFVVHILSGLVSLGADYSSSKINIVAISSNDVNTHPADSPEKMKTLAAEHDFAFPYLYDEDQSVAKAYSAECTPDFFLFDSEDKLVYRGQFDDARPGSDTPVTGADLRSAIDCLLEGAPVAQEQKASMGCNIKWKS